ncbi:MAG: CIA30 family protein [Bacteroidetes bacterium QH_2_63_10]|nr:MAG: CIA30 family protein [Bacteroidetes bacterium QH_2_63_10]
MSTTTLFNFTASADDPAAWRSIDDPVMGGVSQSSFEATDDGAAFTGTVSLKQGGGFASVRAPEADYDLGGHTGLQLRLRGDGKRYWCTVYMDSGGSVSYRTPITPPETWATVPVPFDALTPYRRGRRVPDAPSFDPSRIRTLGFLIADEQAGPFRLAVAWIRAGIAVDVH